MLVEYLLNKIGTISVEEDRNEEHHEKHDKDHQAVEPKQVNGAAELEGHHTEHKQNCANNQEDPSEDIRMQFDEEEDVCCDEAKGGQENEEVEDVEEHIDALVSFLSVNFEGILGRV